MTISYYPTGFHASGPVYRTITGFGAPFATVAVLGWSLVLALLGSRRWYVPQVKLMVWIYRKKASGLLCDGRIRLLNEMLGEVVSQEQAEPITQPLSRFFAREVFREMVLAEQTGTARGRALPLP